MRLSRTKRSSLARKIGLFWAIMGPGLLTATADNDAGGIATYAIVGAREGYSMLWMLFLITFSLAVVQEICARMGAVTGKGLSDLIREEFGVRWTFFAMMVLVIANIATCAAEFAGIAASMEIFGVTKFISVPVMACLVWLVVVRGSYKKVERLLLLFALTFLSYVAAGFLSRPDWTEVAKGIFIPSFKATPGYILLFIATVGTTITPWMQFFIQSTVVDKGIGVSQYAYERLDVFFGAFWTDFISFFIIVSTAATLYKAGITIETASDAAKALAPLAGRYCSYLFAVGLFGASTLAAAVLPLSTSYAVSEAFGWESGLDNTFREAPVFFSIFTTLIVLGAAIVLLTGVSPMKVMLLSQDVNGILLPVILIFMLKLSNNRRVMGEYVNSRTFNIVAWSTAAVVILLTAILLVLTVFPGIFHPGGI
ncbi:MAG TPA: Nramp family divalent metal transporter [Firmicutes bacterium]|nr:Nramp family divalent metal transporter [Bacillota bacterium]